MKKRFVTIIKISFLALLSTFLLTCKKKDRLGPTLPPITQDGKNTFGCKINGEVWVPHFPCDAFTNPCSELQVEFVHPNHGHVLPMQMKIGAGRRDGNNSYFIINSIGAGMTPPTGFFHQTGNIYDSLWITYISGNDYIKSTAPGSFEITKLDTVNNIIAGTFHFKLIASPTDSVLVTDGRFDFKMQDICRCSN